MAERLSDLPLMRIDGTTGTLAAYRGKTLLIVNVASKCGLTPQYEALEALYRSKRDQGFEVLGFPANDFNGQEPGSEAEIAEFCSARYEVSFPMFAKISVRGDDIHPLYAQLTHARPEAVGDGPMRARLTSHGVVSGQPPDVLWNFEKFLVGSDGEVLARFAPDVGPGDPRVVAAIDAALAPPREIATVREPT